MLHLCVGDYNSGTTLGSSLVNIGGTRIACGISARVGVPKQSNPFEGEIIFDMLQSSIFASDSDRGIFYDLSDVEVLLRTLTLGLVSTLLFSKFLIVLNAE